MNGGDGAARGGQRQRFYQFLQGRGKSTVGAFVRTGGTGQGGEPPRPILADPPPRRT